MSEDGAAAGSTTYTVQMEDVILGEHGPEKVVWADIATVTVPRKSPRKRVIGEALRQSGIKPAPDAQPLKVRVLDVASASETMVMPYQPEALWRVS